MAFVEVRVFELINIQAKDINLNKHHFETTIKDNMIHIQALEFVGKGGKVSYRPILPQYRQFFLELIQETNRQNI